MFLKFRKAKNLQEDMHSLTNKLKSMQVKVEKVSLGCLLFAGLWRVSVHLNALLNCGETERLYSCTDIFSAINSVNQTGYV